MSKKKEKSKIVKSIDVISELLVIEQTVFALPFAYIGVLIASKNGAWPHWSIWLWVTLAMFGARTAGMSLNRIIDRKIDSENPRTSKRTIPSGRISLLKVWVIALISLLILVFSAWKLNDLCFYLSPLAAFLLFAYSYCKRFTWFSHFVLGFVEAFAPIGGWFAVTGVFDWKPLLLGLLIVFWMVGLDIIYACQDFEHDRKVGLYSIPSKFGLKKALWFARFAHFVCMVCIVITGYWNEMNLVYWLGAIIVGALFVYEHSLVSPSDLKNVQKAFFKVNSWIAVVLVGFTGIDVFMDK